jgi:hypothetical protein
MHENRSIRKGDDTTDIPRYPAVVSNPPAISTGFLPTLSEMMPAGMDAMAAANILKESTAPSTSSLKPKERM